MISTKITKRVFIAFTDFIILSTALYLSISLRYSFAIENIGFVSWERFLGVFYPFLIIIFLNMLVFYMYGLYDKMTIKIYTELDKRILASQILSSILGAIIFYTIPLFSIAPKTILIIYILISSLLIFFWRKSVRKIFKGNGNTRILLVAEGKELEDLKDEIAQNKILNIQKVNFLSLSEIESLDSIKKKVAEEEISMLAINMHHPKIKNNISFFYEFLLGKVEVVNFADLYEEVLQKVPLDNIDASWFFNNLYGKKNKFYENAKRLLDLSLSIPIFLISLAIYPIIFLVLKAQDGGSLFYISERIGKDGLPFKVYKFRSMTDLKNKDIDSSSKDEAKRITKFGSFLRKTRLDELPQLINIISGDLSLIGPRPEVPTLVQEYAKQIPFYGIRHTVTPGLSGYAQIYQEQKSVPKFGIATDATKDKLCYDIFYLKHRSFLMDLSLMVKTVRNLLSRSGV